MDQIVISVCQSCGSRWFGAIACHCNSCHQTFGKIESFDRHLEREIPGDPDSAAGPCIPVHDLPAAGFTLQNMKLWLSNDPAPIVLPTSEIEI